MAELSELVRSKTRDILTQNIDLSKEKCAEADAYIMEARATGRKNKELISKALILYKESIELYSKLIQPYIGVAYITYSSGEIKQAIGFLNKAKDIDASNPKVNEMLTLFHEELKSEIIHKAAEKSLSQKLNANRKEPVSIFEKISSIFMSNVIKKKHFTPVVVQIDENTPVIQNNINSGNSDNFFDNLRTISVKK